MEYNFYSSYITLLNLNEHLKIVAFLSNLHLVINIEYIYFYFIYFFNFWQYHRINGDLLILLNPTFFFSFFFSKLVD